MQPKLAQSSLDYEEDLNCLIVNWDRVLQAKKQNTTFVIFSAMRCIKLLGEMMHVMHECNAKCILYDVI